VIIVFFLKLRHNHNSRTSSAFINDDTNERRGTKLGQLKENRIIFNAGDVVSCTSVSRASLAINDSGKKVCYLIEEHNRGQIMGNALDAIALSKYEASLIAISANALGECVLHLVQNRIENTEACNKQKYFIGGETIQKNSSDTSSSCGITYRTSSGTSTYIEGICNIISVAYCISKRSDYLLNYQRNYLQH
jgi:hypothetical protein